MELRDAQIQLFVKFAHLYDSGVPLTEALELVRGEAAEPLRGAVEGVVADLLHGSSLADAMAKRPAVFGTEIVGIIRAGERRGELGTAARSAADGLRGRVIDPRTVAEVDIDTVLETAGDACFLHLEPEGRLRLRTPQGLFDGGAVDAESLGQALARRAGIHGLDGSGTMLWRNRLLRVVVASTPAGATTVVRLSGEPGAEPAVAREWRSGRPGLLLVTGGRYADTDACLRSILAAWPDETTKRVAVGLPAPEAVCVGTFEQALAQDPDVVCCAGIDAVDAHDLARAAATRHVAAAVSVLTEFRDMPHRLLRI